MMLIFARRRTCFVRQTIKNLICQFSIWIRLHLIDYLIRFVRSLWLRALEFAVPYTTDDYWRAWGLRYVGFGVYCVKAVLQVHHPTHYSSHGNCRIHGKEMVDCPQQGHRVANYRLLFAFGQRVVRFAISNIWIVILTSLDRLFDLVFLLPAWHLPRKKCSMYIVLTALAFLSIIYSRGLFPCRDVASRHFQCQLSDEDLNCAIRVLELILIRDRYLDLNAWNTPNINYLKSFYLRTEGGMKFLFLYYTLVTFIYICKTRAYDWYIKINKYDH